MDVRSHLLPVLVLAWTSSALAQGGEKLLVSVALGPDAPISEGVRRDCGVEAKLAEEILARVKERIPETERIAVPRQVDATGHHLKVTILAVLGGGGGGWSGSKSIMVRTELLQGTRVITSQNLNRSSKGGIMGGVSGTCPIMDRIAVALGRDVAASLPRPLPDVLRAEAAVAAPATAAPAAPAAPARPAPVIEEKAPAESPK